MNRRPGLVLPALVAAGAAALALALPATASPSASPSTSAAAPSAVPAAAAAPRVPASFTFGGGGFGHGVGMSQYGAQAQAVAGRSAAQILAGYYTGTAMRAVRDDAEIRVQVLGDASSTRITTSSDAAAGGHFTVAVRSSSGTRTLRGVEGDVLAVTTAGATVRLTLTHAGRSTSAAGSRAVVRWQGTRDLAGPATVVAVRGARAHYRWGRLEISSVLGVVNVVEVLRLHEEYLNGIDEVPASWAPAALQAQAIAARTYAIKALAGGVSRWCDCHLYDDTRSQVYDGWDREGQARWGARWASAVRATAPSRSTGTVVTYRGVPIDATYFSSDGGRTENAEDVWANPVPYLRSVPDPWSARAGNPLAAWSRTRTQAQVAAAFGLTDVAVLDLSDRTAGGGVRSAVATSSGGRTARISGGRLESRLGLPSWWVSRAATRMAGAGRWDTVVAAAPAPPADGTVVVAAGDPLPVEAAVAAPLAHHLHAPLLLVTRDAVPAPVARWIATHKVSRVLVVGDAATVSDAVLTVLRTPGVTVTRVAGADRYATSALVAQLIGTAHGAPLTASGDAASLPLAVATAGAAAALDRALLLKGPAPAPGPTPSVTPSPTAAPAPSVTPSASPSVTPSVTPSVQPTPAPAPPAVPPADAAAALLRSLDRVLPLGVVAVAAPGPRQLSDAAVAASLGLPVLFAGPTAVPAATVALLQREPSIARLRVFGGVGSVSGAVVARLQHA